MADQENDYKGGGKYEDEHLVLTFENVKLEIKEGIIKLWVEGELRYNGAAPPVPPIKP